MPWGITLNSHSSPPTPAEKAVFSLPCGCLPCLGFPTPPPADPPPLPPLLPCAAVVMFCLTAVRFTYTAYATFHSSVGLTFATSTAVSYHTRDQMWKCVGAFGFAGREWAEGRQWSGIWVGVCTAGTLLGRGDGAALPHVSAPPAPRLRFPLYLLMYAALGGVAAYLCATFVLPITAGAAPAVSCCASHVGPRWHMCV